ncbi:MAG: prepilin-type N-terminal cleavage/methylation domain-containing protein [Puniceicoccales bacterium]|jgi:type II secretory pathway pseudopilin PulG|nr:prepilin-type N-terminal cleavage/methylation domain-containing protein [Puniceicoccales bacterium]
MTTIGTTRPPRRHRAAFTLVEVMLAVGVLSLAILALVGLIGATFQQVEEIVETNRALAVASTVNATLDRPERVGGDKIPNANDKERSRFDIIYEYAKDAVDKRRLTLFHFTRQSTNTSGQTTVIPIVYRAPGDNFDKTLYDAQDGTGPVYRIDISISPSLTGLRIELDNEARQRDTIYTGGPLPGTSSNYALAYLPLLLEIYPHNFANTDTTKAIAPILSQEIAINR